MLEASETFHVLAIVPLHAVPTRSPSTPDTEPLPPQLSVQSKDIMAGTSLKQATVTGAGSGFNTGGSLSVTTTLNVQSSLPHELVAVAVTVVVPTGKI